MFTDRFGNELEPTTGSKSITINGRTGTLYWNRQGNVVTYLLDITLGSDSGGRYQFDNFLPYNHPLTYATISSHVAQTDLRTYGDMFVNSKTLVVHTPNYAADHTIRGSLTVVVAD